MATPTFISAGAGDYATTGSVVVTKTVTVGNFVVFHYIVDGNTTDESLTSISGVEDLSGAANSLTTLANQQNVGGGPQGRQTVLLGRATSTSVSVTMNVGASGTDMYGRWYEFSGVGPGTTLSAVVENDASTFANQTANATSVPDTNVITNGSDRLALQFVGIGVFRSAQYDFTGETGGTWSTNAFFSPAFGTGATIQLHTAAMASAGTVGDGSFTMDGAFATGVIGAALIGVSLLTPNPQYGYGR